MLLGEDDDEYGLADLGSEDEDAGARDDSDDEDYELRRLR